MVFADLALTMENACTDFDTFLESYDSVINDLYTEGGDDKSSPGVIDKGIKAIKALGKKIKEFIEKIINAVKDFFSKDDTKETLKKADKVLKDPKFKDEKIEVVDVEKVEKINRKYQDNLAKELAGLKSGKSKDAKLENLKAEYERDMRNAAIKKTVGLAAAASLIVVFARSLSNTKNRNYIVLFEGNDNPEVANASEEKEVENGILKVYQASGELLNKEVRTLKDGMTSLFNAIKAKVAGAKTGNTKPLDINDVPIKGKGEIKESVDPMDALMSELDSAIGFDVVESLKDIEDEITEESTDPVTIGEYLDMLESEVIADNFFMQSMIEKCEIFDNSDISVIESELDLAFACLEGRDTFLEKDGDEKSEANKGFLDHLAKAGEALINAIKKLIANIKKFFTDTFGPKSKTIKEDYEEAVKKNPSIKDKIIKIFDMKKFNKECGDLENQAESTLKKLSSGVNMQTDGLIESIKKFCGGSAIAVTAGITVEAALQMASSSREVASIMCDKLENDAQLQQTLVDAIGKKEYNRFHKDIECMKKEHSLRKSLLQLRGYKAQSLEGAITSVYNQVEGIIGSVGKLSAINSESPSTYGIKKAGHFLKHGDEVGSELKNIKKNHGGRIARTMMGNKTAKDAVKAAMKYTNDQAKSDKARDKAVAKAQKQQRQLAGKSKDKSNQSLYDSLTGRYDPNAKASREVGSSKLGSIARKLI